MITTGVKYENNVEEFLGATDAKTLDMFREVAELLVSNIKEEVPVKTGALRDATVAEVDNSGITVANSMDYAPDVEMGTSKQSANPYTRRAIANSLSELESIARDNLKV